MYTERSNHKESVTPPNNAQADAPPPVPLGAKTEAAFSAGVGTERASQENRAGSSTQPQRLDTISAEKADGMVLAKADATAGAPQDERAAQAAFQAIESLATGLTADAAQRYKSAHAAKGKPATESEAPAQPKKQKKAKSAKAPKQAAPAPLKLDEKKVATYKQQIAEKISSRQATPRADSLAVFQFCGAQFGAEHDIDVHKELIAGFFQAATEAGLTPQFELRQFNMLTEAGDQRALQQFQANLLHSLKSIEPNVSLDNFSVILKTNRDELLPPGQNMPAPRPAWVNAFQNNLTQLLESGEYKEPLKSCPLGVQRRTPAEKSPAESFRSGQFTLPPDAQRLATLSSDELLQISQDTAESKPLRYLAHLQLSHSVLPQVDESLERPQLQRYNSDQSIDVAVFTNFVIGSDSDSKEAVLNSAARTYEKSVATPGAPLVVVGLEARAKDYDKTSPEQFSDVFTQEDPNFIFEQLNTTSVPQISEVDGSRLKKQPMVAGVVPIAQMESRATSIRPSLRESGV